MLNNGEICSWAIGDTLATVKPELKDLTGEEMCRIVLVQNLILLRGLFGATPMRQWANEVRANLGPS